MTTISAPEDVGALWLRTLQRAMGRASHDVNDLLNGVSVNLEVVRSRAARPDTPASAIAAFSDAAGQQLTRLASLIDAVLALSRRERDPADVAATLRRVASLCSASASTADGTVRVQETASTHSTLTRVPGDALRLALTATILELVEGEPHALRAPNVVCTLTAEEEAVTVVMSAEGRRPVLPDGVAALVQSAGVRWTAGENDLSLTFARA